MRRQSPELGHGVEEIEKASSTDGGVDSEMGVGDDDESTAQHGAKDDPLNSRPQPV